MKSADSLATAAKAEAEVERFIDKFDSKNQTLIGAIRRVLRQRLPTANELVYDAQHIKSPPVAALIQASIDLVRSPLQATRKGKTIVRSVSAKQRPRTK